MRAPRLDRIQNAILDKNAVVVERATAGVEEHDRARSFIVSSGGLTEVVGEGQVMDAMAVSTTSCLGGSASAAERPFPRDCCFPGLFRHG
jgi:hypothetical protein